MRTPALAARSGCIKFNKFSLTWCLLMVPSLILLGSGGHGLVAEESRAEETLRAESRVPFAFPVKKRVFNDLLEMLPQCTVTIDEEEIQGHLAKTVQHLMPDDWTGDPAAVAREICRKQVLPQLRPQVPAFNETVNHRLDDRYCAGAVLYQGLSHQMEGLNPVMSALIAYDYVPAKAPEEGRWHNASLRTVCGDAQVGRSYETRIDGRIVIDLSPYGHDRTFRLSIGGGAEVSCQIAFSWKHIESIPNGTTNTVRFRPVATVTATRDVSLSSFTLTGDRRVVRKHVIEHPAVHEVVLQAATPKKSLSEEE